ncbi:tetratricopeptide repeat protein [Aureispira anguillae]|uniref:Tetratricopeptide repeat protein n=1 Tax=Aureispira anguillae TaxID=2864201 RepID=A0A915YFC6_9BACT|nr:tetratricopeptide repeat protein [Aureispira anguillae]BDS11971.1 tetratricopeptide repeat protein [Aureispira anguillae]
MRFFITLSFIFFAAPIFSQKENLAVTNEAAANEAIFLAESYFREDSFELAFNGRDSRSPSIPNFLGFKDIIEQYKDTKAANLAYRYAGVCLLNMGAYTEAIGYLSNFQTKDPFLQITNDGLIGDAYAELNDFQTALKYYTQAINGEKDEMLTPYFLYKIGLLMEIHFKDLKKAKKYYQKISNNYPTFAERQNIEADLIRITGDY